MPKSKRRWNEDEIAKLKALAGKEPGERIAVELGRTLEARRAVAVSTQRRLLHMSSSTSNFRTEGPWAQAVMGAGSGAFSVAEYAP